MKNITEKQKKVGSIALMLSIAAIGVLFYILNLHYPVYLDDWVYSLDNTGYKSDSFWSILQAEHRQYLRWGGRSVVHTIARTLLWFGETWSDILNTLAYLALTLLIYLFANRQRQANVQLYILINVLIWFSLPYFSQNLLWITGSANYLWGCLIIYAFILYYVNHLFNRSIKDKLPQRLGILIFGVIAGWTNENMGIALIFFLVVVLIYLKYKKEPIPQWMLWGLAGVIIGYALMMLSPGNARRSQMEFLSIHKFEEVPLSFYFYRLVTVIKISVVKLKYLSLIYVFLMALYLWKSKQSGKAKVETIGLSILFLCSSVVATIVMCGSPSFPDRAWFGIIILFITSVVILYANIDFSGLILKVSNIAVISALIILYIASFIQSYPELLRFEEVCLRRDKMADEAIRNGDKNVIIRDSMFIEKQSPLIVLKLEDGVMLDDLKERYGKYKGVESIDIISLDCPADCKKE